MKFIGRTFFVVVTLASVGGCASWPPSADLRERVPTIEIGQSKPEAKDYILFVPAGKDIPVTLKVGGAFFSKEGSAGTEVRIGRDLYLYKQWASLDGKNWQCSHDLFDAQVFAGIDPEGGKVAVQMNGPK